MNLRRLSHVVALAEEQHFARAAARVHLTQPAFSRSIQAIEEELGLRLFDRETGEVRATPAGAFVIERARRLLFDARCLQRDVDLYRDSQIGDIAFGVGPVVAMELMPRVLSELRAAYPSVTFVDAILGKGELLVKPEQAATVTRILDAIYESSREGKPVYFND